MQFDFQEEVDDPTDQHFKAQQELESEIDTILANPLARNDLMGEWKVIDNVLESKHLEFNGENLKEFSGLYGEEFINLLSKRHLDPEERKIFNLTLKVRLANLIHALVAQKFIQDLTTANADLFDKLNEKLYLENESAVNHLIDDLQQKLESHDQAIRAAIKQDELALHTTKDELIQAVKDAEQLCLDLAEQRGKILKGVGDKLKLSINKTLERPILWILQKEKEKRRLLTKKVFNGLLILFGASLFLLGIVIHHSLK